MPKNEEEKKIKAAYDKVKGSAVNPVLREGNSDRRAAVSVKKYAQKHPHKMGQWSADSKSHVAHMSAGDFYGNEKSMTILKPCTARIEFVGRDGTRKVLKDKVALEAGEVVDATKMSVAALRSGAQWRLVLSVRPTGRVGGGWVVGYACKLYLKCT